MTLDLCFDAKVRAGIGDDCTFGELAEGRTWLTFPYRDVRMEDFVGSMTDDGILAILPALLIGCLYPDEADVFRDHFPNMLLGWATKGRLASMTPEQRKVVCRWLEYVSSPHLDEHELALCDGFREIAPRFTEIVCDGTP